MYFHLSGVSYRTALYFDISFCCDVSSFKRNCHITVFTLRKCSLLWLENCQLQQTFWYGDTCLFYSTEASP